jgi:hypothetical protein
MRRHPKVSVRRAEGISLSRAQKMNKEDARKYFDLLKKTLLENNVMKKPGNILKVDESGLQFSKKTGYFLAKTGSKNVHLLTSILMGETISVIAVAARRTHSTHSVPHACIFKGVKKKQEFEESLPPGSAVMSKKSAYVASEIFMAWMKDHFLPRKPSGKVNIVLVGHSSRFSNIEILEFSNAKEIVLLCLPSHSTH